jgi:Xaa-Pro aminopeptidase
VNAAAKEVEGGMAARSTEGVGASSSTEGRVSPPFDASLLDDLLDRYGIDVLVASSKHNVQYLLGGYRFFFFDHFDAIGVSRYLPLLVYPKGQPDRAGYFGNRMESYEKALGKFWTPEMRPCSFGTLDAVDEAAAFVKRLASGRLRIGVERAFLPADAEARLRESLPGCEIVEAQIALERLRAVKTPEELALVRQASERVVDAMLAVIASHGEGTTKLQLAEALRREEVLRGLDFDYCLIAAGVSRNRAPSEQPWREGEVLSLDSGGNYRGYIGDLCRMAILGEPDAELEDLLAEIEEIQQAARKPIRAGARGGDIFDAAEPLVARSANRDCLEFVAHGMGLVSHEAPRLTARGPVPYAAEDAELPLKAGMVLSIETTLGHPRRGFIKLEDTVAVTETGWEAYGDHARGWNRGGAGVGHTP